MTRGYVLGCATFYGLVFFRVSFLPQCTPPLPPPDQDFSSKVTRRLVIECENYAKQLAVDAKTCTPRFDQIDIFFCLYQKVCFFYLTKETKQQLNFSYKSFSIRDVSLFSGMGGYQFFKQGSQKILTLPLNTNKKILTLPQP